MIAVNKVSVLISGRYLYNDVSFNVNEKDRIGLVGVNGAGKSTLLKLFAGLQQADEGGIAFPNHTTVGYLPQEMSYHYGRTVRDETASAFAEARTLEKKIEYFNLQLTERTDYESEGYMQLIHDLNEAGERYHVIGGHSLEGEMEKVLLGLGFEREDFNRLTDEFSGGWRMRIELAKILLQKPDLLLLDEPTNHLDIESIQWLEDFLKTYHGAIILVSHDRAFLDNLTNRTIEISMGKIYDYKASYSKYVELRTERREQQLATAKNQQKQIEDTEKFIDRFRYKASKARQVQSKLKQLEKIDRVEVDDEDNKAIHFRFSPAPRSGKIVVEGKNIKKQYDNHVVFSNVNFAVERGEKIAFVGRNGEGKSTLSKIIVNEENCEGNLNIGYNVSIGYYAQNQADFLDGEKTIFETINDMAPDEIRSKVRTLLGSFLFSGDDTDKKVKILSGGEKARVALCKLLLSPVNLLIMDEPTNHLDMRSKDILKDALLHYDGTLLLVSHDRDFLNGLTQKVYEFRNGNIKEHIGDVYEFLRNRKLESFREMELSKNTVKEKSNRVEEKSGIQISRELKKQIENDIRKIKNNLEQSENKIARLENEIAALDAQLLNPDFYKSAEAHQALEKYNRLKNELEAEMTKWEMLQEELSKIELKNSL
jgi:ATP-binding cassette subfamily F protein 3